MPYCPKNANEPPTQVDIRELVLRMARENQSWGEQFRVIIKSAGMEPLRLPGRFHNLNAFAERFVRSIKDSCLDQLVFFGESSLRRAVSEFVLHYHTERNQQGLENKIIQPEFAEFPEIGTISSRQRLGGLLAITTEKPHDLASFEFLDSTPRTPNLHASNILIDSTPF